MFNRSSAERIAATLAGGYPKWEAPGFILAWKLRSVLSDSALSVSKRSVHGDFDESDSKINRCRSRMPPFHLATTASQVSGDTAKKSLTAPSASNGVRCMRLDPQTKCQ